MTLEWTTPDERGCWFCNKTEPIEDMCFSMEWDCEVHDKCAQEQAALNNPEALIMLREWGEISDEECSKRYEEWRDYDKT